MISTCLSASLSRSTHARTIGFKALLSIWSALYLATIALLGNIHLKEPIILYISPASFFKYTLSVARNYKVLE